VNWILSYVLNGAEEGKIARRIDETIAKLPGLGWFNRLSASRKESLKRTAKHEAPSGAVVLSS
jgi:hypothetical protein